MAYSDTPIRTDGKNKSQGEMNENFLLIKAYVGENHEDFDSLDVGKHKKVTFTQQAGDQVTGANEMALYTKDVGGVSTLFLRKENNGDVLDLSPTDVGHAAAGYEVLPSGLIMNWGKGTAHTGADNRIVFTKAFTDSVPAVGVPEPNVFSIQMTLYTDADRNDFISVVNGTIRYNEFYARSWTRSGEHVSTSTFFYLAIGK